MHMQTPQWRSGTNETAWLSAMINAMERVSCAELRATRSAPALRAAVEAQLARPAVAYAAYGSKFSWHN
jgi:cysteine sulfinate desulfinase/cysteine desulfurase-like protein